MIIQHKISLFVFPYAFEFKFNMFISPTKIVISFETTKLIRYFLRLEAHCHKVTKHFSNLQALTRLRQSSTSHQNEWFDAL